MVPAGGIEPSCLLNPRKLFIPSYDKTEKKAKNAEARYAAGTRSMQTLPCLVLRLSIGLPQ